MSETQLDLDALAAEGIGALMDRLGPVRTIQFIRLCNHSVSDYTAERGQWLGNLRLGDVLDEAVQGDGQRSR